MNTRPGSTPGNPATAIGQPQPDPAIGQAQPAPAPGLGKRVIWNLSGLLKSLWTFFPSLLFVLFAIFCFWVAGQGKDIIVAFTENKSVALFSLHYTRLISFLAIGFWVYITWYSSRIVAYIKKKKQQDFLKKAGGLSDEAAEKAYDADNELFGIGKSFLDEFPRLTGNASLLVLELAVLQSPILPSPISSFAAFLLLPGGLIGLYFLNKWIRNNWSQQSFFRTFFWVLLIVFFILLFIASFFKIYILSFLGLLFVFHGVFIFYTNLRRANMEKKAAEVRVRTENQDPARRDPFEKIMDYFCIPRIESGYFRWFLLVGIVGLLIYLITIFNLGFARRIGPFPFIILAFGVLLAFGNIVTAFSVRYRINFHFLLLLIAFFAGLKETHYVKTIDLKGVENNYAGRPSLETYLHAWLDSKVPLADTSAAPYDVFFVMANGGASRSGYWTASVLGKLEDSSLARNAADRFSDHLFCLSGTSGGGVGVATFFSLLRNQQPQASKSYAGSARDFLKQDYFTYTFARMLGPDFFNYVFHFSQTVDRAAALGESFEESAHTMDSSDYQVPFYEPLSQFTALDNKGRVSLPILFVNTTRMQDGNPGVITNLALDSGLFDNRVDVLKLLDNDKDISITSGSLLGARFPYLSPAGRIGNNYFVDGGYFDNSGAGVVQEIIRGIINIAKDDSLRHGTLYRQVQRLHFRVLHIVNSPVLPDSSDIQSVAPIKNDLLAPLFSIVGAYDMQTTVNDGRLRNFIQDIKKYSFNQADYTRISLYEDQGEWMEDPLRQRYKIEPPYAMNWFMSDTTLRRIDIRLEKQPVLLELIHRRQ